MNWDEIKSVGSDHYKNGKIEPIDLYRSLGILRPFALASIIKYASRNGNKDKVISIGDMHKIIHYAQMLIATCGEDFPFKKDTQTEG